MSLDARRVAFVAEWDQLAQAAYDETQEMARHLDGHDDAVACWMLTRELRRTTTVIGLAATLAVYVLREARRDRYTPPEPVKQPWWRRWSRT